MTTSVLAARPIRVDADGAKVALVGTTALLLGGDQVELEFKVGPGAWLEIVDTAGTVAYDAQGQESSWIVSIRVAPGGTLIWHGEPFIVSAGANVHRQMFGSIAADGVALIRETLVFGRSGEVGGALRSQSQIAYDGEALLVEDLDLRSRVTRELPGVLGDLRVVDTLAMYGAKAPVVPGILSFDLAGPGTLGRYLGSELHHSTVPALIPMWTRSLQQSQVSRRSRINCYPQKVFGFHQKW